ncbi:unnamed protein product [Bursaphelenchus okinawaensis]|uniref:Rab-GAP TBC domain-containing protein n=1 Tax=Bursaphelenchus okinawaensis TaxID=465554 RepID=A0A811L6U3_9BILA|nr:unnamed protein product [Bursaphelenchus okinawaensis]CAG9116906.1 unnamed protein product [Bursaphelenchus okinawaensis]
MALDSEVVKMLDDIDLPHHNKVDVVKNARLEARQRKKKKIAEILADSKNDEQLYDNLSYFRRFATTSGGLLEHEFRLAIWPVLANTMPYADGVLKEKKIRIVCERFHESSCSDSDFFESARSSLSLSTSTQLDSEEDEPTDEIISPSPSIEDLQKHVEWNQVELDVNRTLARFPPNISETERLTLQADLSPMIVQLLYMNSNFRYYQGFHDICLTLLLALDVEKAKQVARNICQRSSLRNYLTKSLEESALAELNLMYVILNHCDPQIEKVLRGAELGTLFALSWPITWFSHSLRSFDQVVLCFDMFLSSHYLMPIYVSAALVEHRRQEILVCEPEMPSLHHLLNNVPANIDIQCVLERAQELYNLYPPSLVQGPYLRDYEALCIREKSNQMRCQQQPPLQRHNALGAPWLVMGTAAAGMAAYWMLSKYTTDISSLL